MIRWMTVTMVFPLIYFHWNVHIFFRWLWPLMKVLRFLGCPSSPANRMGWLTSGTYVGTDGSNLSDPKSWWMTDDQRSCQEFSLLFLLGAWQWLVHQRVSQVPSTIIAFDQFSVFFCLLRLQWIFTPPLIMFCSSPGLEANQANGLATKTAGVHTAAVQRC